MSPLTLGLLVAGAIAAAAAGWRDRPLVAAVPRAGPSPTALGGGRRAVSVVIPARDEAAVLPRLLASLAAQDHPSVEVTVVDDGSSDGTAAVAEARGARVLRPGEPPPGWAGKPWACRQGVAASTHDVIVLLDADTWLAPHGLDLLIAAHAALTPDGLLSIQPRHHVERPYEELSLFANVVPLLASGTWLPRRRPEPPATTASPIAPSTSLAPDPLSAPDGGDPLGSAPQDGGLGDAGAGGGRVGSAAPGPRSDRVVAFGPCLVTTREALEAAGGFEAVAGEVLEDVALAKAYWSAGRPVHTRTGGDVVGFRMYPAGVGQLIEGWTKNLAGGAGRAPVGPTLAAALWVTALAALSVEAVLRPTIWLLPAWALAAGQVWWLARRAGTFSPWSAVLFPIPLWAFVGLCLRSAWHRVVRRRVSWRGRTIATGGGR